MADYYPIIARAVSRLDKNTGEARLQIYARARSALTAQLRQVKDPPLDQTQIAHQQNALEEAIKRAESEAAAASRSEPSAPKPSARQGSEQWRELERILEAQGPAPSAVVMPRRRPAPALSPPPRSDPRRPDGAATRPANARPKVFISYRRDDARYQARDIYRALTRTLPAEHVFMDVDSIPLGANFVTVLEGWVDQCDMLLALIGPGWTRATNPATGMARLHEARDFVRIEVRKALQRNIPVVPVLLDDAPLPREGELPDDLKELLVRQAAFVNFRTFDVDVDRLIQRLGIARKPR